MISIYHILFIDLPLDGHMIFFTFGGCYEYFIHNLHFTDDK